MQTSVYLDVPSRLPHTCYVMTKQRKQNVAALYVTISNCFFSTSMLVAQGKWRTVKDEERRKGEQQGFLTSPEQGFFLQATVDMLRFIAKIHMHSVHVTKNHT